MDTHTIPLRLSTTAVDQAELSYDEDSELCILSFTYRDLAISVQASDYFEALCQIRLQLEAQQIQLLCYGASKNVYPSGMARDMGQGRRAYKLTMGKQATMADLVDIFATGTDIQPVTVEEQRRFYESWLTDRKIGNERPSL
jgi:hypothetical protein